MLLLVGLISGADKERASTGTSSDKLPVADNTTDTDTQPALSVAARGESSRPASGRIAESTPDRNPRLDATPRSPAAAVSRSTPSVVKRVFRVTAYCDQGITAAGVPSGVGQCAAPADIPFGSRIYVPELGTTFIVTDRTHKRFRHNTVDLFIPTRSRCLEFGRHYLECEVYPPEETYDYASSRLARAVEHTKERVRLPK